MKQWSNLNNYVFGTMTNDTGRMHMRPWYDVFSWFARSAGGRVLPVTATWDVYSVNGRGNEPSRSNIELVQAIAVKDDDGNPLTLLINHSPDIDVAVILRIRGAVGRSSLSAT